MRNSWDAAPASLQSWKPNARPTRPSSQRMVLKALPFPSSWQSPKGHPPSTASFIWSLATSPNAVLGSAKPPAPTLPLWMLRRASPERFQSAMSQGQAFIWALPSCSPLHVPEDFLPSVWALTCPTHHSLHGATFLPAQQPGGPRFATTRITNRRTGRGEEASPGWERGCCSYLQAGAPPARLLSSVTRKAEWLQHSQLPQPLGSRDCSQDKPQHHNDKAKAYSTGCVQYKCLPQGLGFILTRLVRPGPWKAAAQQLSGCSKTQGCLTPGLASPRCG